MNEVLLVPQNNTFSWRKSALVVFFLSLYIPHNWPMRNFNVNLSDIFFFFLSVLFIGRVLLSGRTRFRVFDARLFWPIAGFVFYSLLQLFFVESPFRVSAGLCRIFQISLLILVLSGDNFVVFTRLDSRIFLRALYYFSLIGAVIAIVYASLTGRRFYGIWSVWFVFGSFSYGFYYCFYRLVFLKRQRLMEYLALFVFLWAIMLSRTRGLWLIISATLVLVFLIRHRPLVKVWRFKNLFLIGLCLMEIVFIVASSREIKARSISIFTGEQKRDARLYRWATSLRVFSDHPWGVGIGNNRYFTLDYAIETSPDYPKVLKLRQMGPDVTGPRYGAHSDWFTLLAETGLLGVGLYIYLWSAILLDVAKRSFYCVDAFVAVSFLATLFMSTFIGNIFLVGGGGAQVIFFYYFVRKITRASLPGIAWRPKTGNRAYA